VRQSQVNGQVSTRVPTSRTSFYPLSRQIDSTHRS
jgi:hypothetical protein